MKKNYVVRKRQNKILYLELIIAAILFGLASYYKLKIHPALSLLVSIGAFILIAYLFSHFRIFRYFFVIVFSISWAIIAFAIGASIDKDSLITRWVFASLSFAISIWAHYDHYKFLRNVKVYEYEKN